MTDKLFYSYNSPWINNNSITYTEKYSYALIVNPKNHILAYNGKDYGVFHNENYISCIPQSNFINTSNIVTSQSVTSICIKIPSNPHTIWTVTSGTGAGSPANHSSLDLTPEASDRLSFDLSVGSSLYHISAILNSTTKSKKFWSTCNVVKLSNSNTNNNINFGYYRTSASTNSNLSTHSYLPYISVSGFSGVGIPVSIYNLSFSSASSNGFNTVNYPHLNYVDNAKKTSYMWQIKLGTSSTYFIDTTITPTQMIPNGKIQQHNIWGQSFDGTNDVYGTLTLNSDNKWEHFSSGEQNSYVLRSTYLKINTTSTDRSCRVEVNGNTIIAGTEKLRGELQINDNYSSSDGRIVLNNKPATEASPTRLEILASNAKDEGMGLYNRTFTHTYSSSTNTNGNWWILRQTYSGVSSATDTNKSWKTILGDNVNVGIGETRPQAKLHVNGNTYIGSGTSANRYFGINTTPTGQSLRVTGDSYLGYNNGNVGIGIAPDTGNRLKVDGSSSHLSTLFSNGKIILNDEYTFIQKIHAAGLQPHYDISNSGSNGILNMYISNNATTLWHSNYTNSNLGIHKIFSAQANINNNYCGLWNMGLWNYRHYNASGQDLNQQTKAGMISSSVITPISEYRYNSQLGGLNMILFYHTVKNNTAELTNNVNYVFRSAYRNRILFYGSYVDSTNYTWQYKSPSTNKSWGVVGNDTSGTMDSTHFGSNTSMPAVYGDFGGFVSCMEGNIYNIVVLGVVNLYKTRTNNAWSFNNSVYNSILNDTSFITSSGVLIYGCWFANALTGTNHNGLSSGVANANRSIRFRCKVNPNLTWKRHIHVSNTICEIHTQWGQNDSSINGPVSADNGNKYELHSGFLNNNNQEIQIYIYGPNINDTGTLSARTISVTILGWLYDGDN